jgi:hypothetical protein
VQPPSVRLDHGSLADASRETLPDPNVQFEDSFLQPSVEDASLLTAPARRVAVRLGDQIRQLAMLGAWNGRDARSVASFPELRLPKWPKILTFSSFCFVIMLRWRA